MSCLYCQTGPFYIICKYFIQIDKCLKIKLCEIHATIYYVSTERINPVRSMTIENYNQLTSYEKEDFKRNFAELLKRSNSNDYLYSNNKKSKHD